MVLRQLLRFLWSILLVFIEGFFFFFFFSQNFQEVVDVFRRFFVVLVFIILIVVFLGYLGYGYLNYESLIYLFKLVFVKIYLVFKLFDGCYFFFIFKEYVNLIFQGFKLFVGVKGYVVNVMGYVIGIFEVDVNVILRVFYEKFIIIIGDINVKLCLLFFEEFVGSCVERIVVVFEISVLILILFKRYYYWKGFQEGMDNVSVKVYVYEEILKRYDIRYLMFFIKFFIGFGCIGNRKYLVVVLLGFNEGVIMNRIIVLREGLIVFEGKFDSVFCVEVVFIEYNWI